MTLVHVAWRPYRVAALTSVAALLSLLGIAIPVGQGLLSDLTNDGLPLQAKLGWAAIAATAALLLATLWDVTAIFAVGGAHRQHRPEDAFVSRTGPVVRRAFVVDMRAVRTCCDAMPRCRGRPRSGLALDYCARDD